MPFNQLPLELNYKIARFLPTSSINALQKTSKTHWTLFKPVLNERKFLHEVMRGNYKAVEEMLKEDWSLILTRTLATDYSGRYFECISAFEYALWALDQHMWTFMLGCIPAHERHSEIFTQLRLQYDRINTEGVFYKLNAETITEKHFNFENTIINALQKQVNLIKRNATNSDKHFRKKLGGAQKLLPMHVVHQYCSEKPFFIQGPLVRANKKNRTRVLSESDFTSKPSLLSQQFKPWGVKDPHYRENWFAAASRLGIDFAIYKGKSGPIGTSSGGSNEIERDLSAIKLLYDVRKRGFNNLKLQLEAQIKTAYQP